MKPPIEFKSGVLRIAHVHDPPLARRELPGSRYRHPFAHSLRKPERIDARPQFRSGLDRENFDVGLDRLHQILDALERSRDRTRTAAACALVMHGEPVALE